MCSVEGEAGGGADEAGVVVAPDSVKPKIIAKTNPGGGGGEEVSGDIELCVAPEDNPGGIHQVKVGVAAANLNDAVNDGRVAADNAGEDVLELGRGEEVGDLVGIESELLETVEEVGSVAAGGAALDVELVAVLQDFRAGAVGSREGLGKSKSGKQQ